MEKINFELAKKLKDAGFPQEGAEFYWSHYPDLPPVIDHKDRNTGSKICVALTLSELIEACGKIGVKIGYQEDGRIYAEFDKDDGNGNLIDFCMDSLEEIYANLWLELNKK